MKIVLTIDMARKGIHVAVVEGPQLTPLQLAAFLSQAATQMIVSVGQAESLIIQPKKVTTEGVSRA